MRVAGGPLIGVPPILEPQANGPDTGCVGTVEYLLARAVSPTSVELSWPNVASAAGYDVMRDGVIIAPAGSYADTYYQDFIAHTFTDVGLTPETAYAYCVRAVI